MSPGEMREAVLADLEPLSGQKGVKSLMHVVKNWCFEARCIQAELVVQFYIIY